MAILGLRCCSRAFSSCIEQELLSRCGAQASHCHGFSCGAQALGLLIEYLWYTGLVALWHVRSSRTQD